MSASLSVRRPGLQGHAARVEALGAEELAGVRRQHDVHGALRAQILSERQTENQIHRN